MPFFNRHDEQDSNAWEEDSDRSPRRPRPTFTNERRYSSRRPSSIDDEHVRRERKARPLSASPEKMSRSPSKERRYRERRARDEGRDERRREREARYPEKEARRRERRAARETARGELAPNERVRQDEEREARRQARRDARRAERRASRLVSQEQEHFPVPLRQENDVTAKPGYERRQPTPEPTFETYHGEYDTTTSYSATHDAYAEEKLKDRVDAQAPPRPQFARPSSQRLRRGESWHSSADDCSVDLESFYNDEKRQTSSRSTSNFDELDWYKRGRMTDRGYDEYREERRGCCGRSRKCTISIILASIIVLIIIIAVPVAVSRNEFTYTPSIIQVNNTAAFSSGGATTSSVNSTSDGIGAGADVYKYYQGPSTNFPNNSLWISFDDMWNNNLATLQQACGWLHYGSDDTTDEITNIYNAVQDRANASLVDHRFILAILLQESHGCVHVPHTTSSGGVKNTGLMQAHDGHEYNSGHSHLSILTMVQDGTQGTKNGDGLVQLLNMYGDPYRAARGYNSGYIPASGDLSEAAGATACYVSDVANRLTGWVSATNTCPT